jgi:hypothetical protein
MRGPERSWNQRPAITRTCGVDLTARGSVWSWPSSWFCSCSRRAYIRGMGKAKVVFKMQRIEEENWQIQAHYPGAEVRYIKGFKSKAEVNEWLAGSRRIDWLRSQGYAK